MYSERHQLKSFIFWEIWLQNSTAGSPDGDIYSCISPLPRDINTCWIEKGAAEPAWDSVEKLPFQKHSCLFLPSWNFRWVLFSEKDSELKAEYPSPPSQWTDDARKAWTGNSAPLRGSPGVSEQFTEPAERCSPWVQPFRKTRECLGDSGTAGAQSLRGTFLNHTSFFQCSVVALSGNQPHHLWLCSLQQVSEKVRSPLHEEMIEV